MSRSVMLKRIRSICALSESIPLPSRLPDFPTYEDPVDHFRRQLEMVDGHFWDGRCRKQLTEALAGLLEKTKTREIYWEQEAIFRKHDLPYRLRNPQAFADGLLVYSLHFQGQVQLPLVLHSKPYKRETLAAIELSASSAAFGLAETGTVGQQVRSGTGRLLSVLPPQHVTLLSETDLLANHRDFFAQAQLGETGSLLSFITGPSRTADIEKTLVVGVHGPQRWDVILTS